MENINSQSKKVDEFDEKSNFWPPFLFACVVVIILFAIYWILFAHGNSTKFGDSFEPLTALFTGLAFAGVIATLWMQRKDIKITQEELKKSVSAQQDMASKMGLEVSFAKMSSDLELLNKYIQVVSNDSSTALSRSIKQVITQLTKQLIREKRFLYAVTPILHVGCSRSASPQKTGQFYESTLLVSAQKFNITINKIDFEPLPDNINDIKNTRNVTLSEGQNILYDLKYSVGRYNVLILYKDLLMENEWQQEYLVEYGNSVRTNGPEFIETQSERE